MNPKKELLWSLWVSPKPLNLNREDQNHYKDDFKPNLIRSSVFRFLEPHSGSL